MSSTYLLELLRSMHYPENNVITFIHIDIACMHPLNPALPVCLSLSVCLCPIYIFSGIIISHPILISVSQSDLSNRAIVIV